MLQAKSSSAWKSLIARSLGTEFVQISPQNAPITHEAYGTCAIREIISERRRLSGEPTLPETLLRQVPKIARQKRKFRFEAQLDQVFAYFEFSYSSLPAFTIAM